MDQTYSAPGDVVVLPTHVDFPDGALIVNSFLVLGEQPMLFDTGLGIDRREFIAAIEEHVSLADLRWIWLSHDDIDHTGNLEVLLQLAPNATLATAAFSAFRMSTAWEVPMHRVHALAVGDTLDIGDRTLRVVRPPTFDNPMSIGALDESNGSLFSVDAFGAVLPEPTTDAWSVPEEALIGGMVAWGTMDSPWAHLVQTDRFEAVIDDVRRLQPARIYSSHLPAATKGVDRLIDALPGLRDADPAPMPTNEEFQAMLAATAPAPA